MFENRVLVATPAYGGMVNAMYASSIAGTLNWAMLQRCMGLELLLLMNESLITRARNECLHRFYKSDATHLLFIDSDISFPPEAIAQLLSHRLPLVGGLYPLKTLEETRFAGELDLGGRRGRLIRAKYLPTGFMLIRRDLVEKLRRAYPDLQYTIDGGPLKGEKAFDLFRTEIVRDDPAIGPGGRLLSEDWAFTRKALSVGVQAWADPTILLEHHGTHVYRAKLPEDVLYPQPQATEKAA